jgi:hypothetical protein
MGRLVSRSEIFSANHFEEPRQLADPGSELSGVLYSLMGLWATPAVSHQSASISLRTSS